MNRENAKTLLPVIQAYAEGKEIEIFSIGDKEWQDCPNPSFDERREYRIKPQATYRPFKGSEECWNEMLKHQPFGWLKAVKLGTIVHITEVMSFVGCGCATFKHVFERYNFADGTPFGIKEGGEQ